MATATIPVTETTRTGNEISQEELARYREIENSIALMKDELDGMKESLIERLRDNTPVEHGSHTATLSFTERRSVSWKGVVIRLKGEGYANNVLKNTKPTLLTSLKVK